MDNKLLNILFVEDSADDVELTLAELTRAGYKITAHRVETAEEMQEALDQQKWDVIISDYKMPQFSAEKSLSVFNHNALDIPFIIISGVVEAEDVVFLLKKGANDFLNKHSLARLVPAIERELRDSKVRKAQRQAEQKISILSLAVEQSPISVVITDPQGIIEYVNPKFELMAGYSSEQSIGKSFGFTVFQEGGTEASNALQIEQLWKMVKQQGNWSGELCNVHQDGSLYWEYVSISPLEDEEGKVIRFVSVHEDITVRRSYEEQLRVLAHHDDLTGLANRTLMMSELNIAIQYSCDNNVSAALLCIDLDHFKNINDTLGHIVGDELLIQAASRLALCTKKSDTLARMGGDEFVIILPKIEQNHFIQSVADRIMHEFSKPFFIQGHEHYVTASIGVAKYPEHSTDPQVLLRNADLAMYQAKILGRNQCQFFTEEINEKLKQRVAIEAALRGVEVRDELELFYQPIVDAQTHQVVVCEALLRWKTNDGHYRMPDTFIPIAEETGLINNLGEWVIRQACHDLAVIHKTISPQIKMAINISPNQLQSTEFSQLIEKELEAEAIPAEMLELEVTESVLIYDKGETHNNLKSLCDMGVNLSIDDFGTGYSSLGYLQKYPFSTLKIDRSFIGKIEPGNTMANHNTKLTEIMITMAHNLGLKVVAEGVETKGQLDFLHNENCDLVQGYLFSKPIPLQQLLEALNKNRVLTF